MSITFELRELKTGSANVAKVVMPIGYFRVAVNLIMKARLSAKVFHMK